MTYLVDRPQFYPPKPHNPKLGFTRTPSIVKGNKSLNLVWSKWGSQWWGFGKVFNALQSLIGQMASRPMSDIWTFSLHQMYVYLSSIERKVIEFYHNIDRRRYLVWLRWLIFSASSGQLMVFLWSKPYISLKISTKLQLENLEQNLA